MLSRAASPLLWLTPIDNQSLIRGHGFLTFFLFLQHCCSSVLNSHQFIKNITFEEVHILFYPMSSFYSPQTGSNSFGLPDLLKSFLGNLGNWSSCFCRETIPVFYPRTYWSYCCCGIRMSNFILRECGMKYRRANLQESMLKCRAMREAMNVTRGFTFH